MFQPQAANSTIEPDFGAFMHGQSRVSHVAQEKKAHSVEMLTVRQLRSRGWTHRMIERFLQSPDSSAQNPHIHSGRPMRLYRADRVARLECEEEFCLALNDAIERSARSTCLYKLKSDALSDIADCIEIRILDLDCKELATRARDEYGTPATTHLQCKNEVTYLLLHAKNAEWGLDAYFWHPGIRMARLKLRRRILVQVIESYAHLADAVLEISRDEAGDASGI